MILHPAFQPIKNVGKGTFVGAEVLARWYYEGQVLSPSSIKQKINWGLVDIEVAAFIQKNFTSWRAKNSAIFINVSDETLATDKYFKTWTGIISQIVKNEGSKVVIEITEGVQDSSLAHRWNEIAELGGLFALDDYGDENSNIVRLNQYAWDYCKFNAKRFHSRVDESAIQYCLENRIQLIAEKIENPFHEEIAKLFGFFLQQGFYHEKPTFLERYMDLVSNSSGTHHDYEIS